MIVLGLKVSTSLGCRPSTGARQVFQLSRGVPLPMAAVPAPRSTSACCSIFPSRIGPSPPWKPLAAESPVFGSLRQVAASHVGCALRPEPSDDIHHHFPCHPHVVSSDIPTPQVYSNHSKLLQHYQCNSGQVTQLRKKRNYFDMLERTHLPKCH